MAAQTSDPLGERPKESRLAVIRRCAWESKGTRKGAGLYAKRLRAAWELVVKAMDTVARWGRLADRGGGVFARSLDYAPVVRITCPQREGVFPVL